QMVHPPSQSFGVASRAEAISYSAQLSRRGSSFALAGAGLCRRPIGKIAESSGTIYWMLRLRNPRPKATSARFSFEQVNSAGRFRTWRRHWKFDRVPLPPTTTLVGRLSKTVLGRLSPEKVG